VRALVRTYRVAWCIGLVAWLFACEPQTTPAPLLGTWYSEDARYEGRTLQIQTHWIRFLDGPTEIGAIRVEGVVQEGSGDGPIRFEIEGTDRDGQEATLSLELVQRPVERLRFETQRHPWRRVPRAGGTT
jgi:hypothetical protein